MCDVMQHACTRAVYSSLADGSSTWQTCHDFTQQLIEAACSEAEERAERELEHSKSEWARLKELEDEYLRSFEAVNERVNGMRGSIDPASRYSRVIVPFWQLIMCRS